MAKRRTPAAQRIDDALTANPNIASRTLARMLYKETPELWPNQTACLTAIRGIRGAAGKSRRHGVKRNVAVRTPEESAACQRWGALLPEPEKTKFQWHDLPKDVSRWLILCDLHFPYYDQQALSAALAHAENNCDGVILLGDVIDFYHLSHWERDPRRRSPSDELVDVGQFLDVIATLNVKIVFKLGNHDFRLERYVMKKAPEMIGLRRVLPGGPGDEQPDTISLEHLLCFAERGIQCVPAGHPLRHHNLTLIHGHEWGNRFSSPVNPARGAFLKAHDCVIEGHGHRTSHHVEQTLRGRPISCWSIGCLCDLNPEYRPLGNKWNHGFAYLNAGSEWSIENHRVINGEVK